MSQIGEDGQYTGEHSISFRAKSGLLGWPEEWVNTNTDWHLVPTSMPVVNPPELKSKEMENAGGDGILDRTESITGFPLYGQRKGSWEFSVLNGWKSWYVLYSEILNYLHGREVQVILKDDAAWYYNGRVTVNQWASDPDRCKITLDYVLDPYKLYMTESNKPWLWDPFSFEDGVITYGKTTGLIVGSGNWVGVTLTGREVGRRPVTPEFIIKSGEVSKISLYNTELYGSNAYILHKGLTTASSYHWMDMILTGFSPDNVNQINIIGTPGSEIEIAYRMGKL